MSMRARDKDEGETPPEHAPQGPSFGLPGSDEDAGRAIDSQAPPRQGLQAPGPDPAVVARSPHPLPQDAAERVRALRSRGPARCACAAGLGLLVAAALWASSCIKPSDPWQPKPAQAGKGRLEVVEGVPVLHLLGTPAERGREHGQLLRRQFKALRESYLEPFLGKEYGEFARVASAFSGFMPADCLEEIQAFAPAAREREEDVLLANTFLDLSRAARCSVAIVAGEASAGGQVLLARNLDFPDLGVAHRATVLKVTHHTEPGLHSFVDVGWPGLVGVLSGMNDSGLCVATLVSFTERGMEPGMPYAMMYRQVLERCTTPQAAVDLVKGAQRTCANSLAVAGPEGEPVVIEFTPTEVAVRRPERGVLVATNDFHKLLPEKQPKVICRRYGDLERLAAGQHGRIDVEFLKEMLRAVAMPAGQSPTLQAMVFEPAARRLHLAVGHWPAPEGAWVTIDCSALFAAK